jgi:hypothetical protein
MDRALIPFLTLTLLVYTLCGAISPASARSEEFPAPIEILRVAGLFPPGMDAGEREEMLIIPLADVEEKDRDYTETPLRRFEIVFFISLPVSILFTLAGTAAFKAGQGRPVDFTSAEYSYILVSSLGISFAIALHDSRIVYGTSRTP